MDQSWSMIWAFKRLAFEIRDTIMGTNLGLQVLLVTLVPANVVVIVVSAATHSQFPWQCQEVTRFGGKHLVNLGKLNNVHLWKGAHRIQWKGANQLGFHFLSSNQQ
jgi:membrane-associated PAP2 superfamily phosphatase